MPTIYMPLLNEGTNVWRPVEGTPLSSDTFRVEGEMPDDEEWEFGPGSVVRCEPRLHSQGECLTAIELAGRYDRLQWAVLALAQPVEVQLSS